MTDVEERLRTMFAADAEGAPDVPPPVLAATVRQRADRLRRRRFATGAAALAVAATAAGVLVVVAPGATRTPPAGPAPSSGPSSGPSSRPSATQSEESALRYRGVVVPVPASYLAPDAVRCGTAVADAAYVREPGQAVRSCLATPEHPESLTTVELMPSDLPPGDGREYRDHEKVLPDGRTRLTTNVPGAPVRVVVTSPDPALARRLFDGLRIESDLAGCALEATGAPEPAVPGGGWLQSVRPVDASVCSYTNGWLHSWRRIGAAEAADLVSLVQSSGAAAEPTAAYCATARTVPRLEQHWVVTLRATAAGAAGGEAGTFRLWVAAGPCTQPGVHVPGAAVAPLTQPLVDRLVRWAPGVTSLVGVVGGKG